MSFTIPVVCVKCSKEYHHWLTGLSVSTCPWCDHRQPFSGLTQVAADWRDAPVKADGSQFDKDYPVKSVGSHANR